MVKRPRKPHRQCTGSFTFNSKVSQHIAHQGLVNQAFSEGGALHRVVERNAQCLTHEAAGTQCAVQAREGTHLQNLRHTASLLTDQPGGGPVELHFGTGIGAVAQLVFEALDMDGVAAAVLQYPRQKETAQSRRGLG